MITFTTTAVFFLAWMFLSMITFLSIQDPTAADNFTNLTDSSFTLEGVTLDDPPIGGTSTGISTILGVPVPDISWMGNIAKAATFQAPIWDSGWSNLVRVVLSTLGGAYLLVIVVKGAEILANILPG